MAGIKSGETFAAATDEIGISRSGDLGTATFSSVVDAVGAAIAADPALMKAIANAMVSTDANNELAKGADGLLYTNHAVV